MKKIATHDSVTGERSKNFWYKLLVPFARTQTKTIKEQCEAGCSYFDIRIKGKKRSSILKYDCGHGLWQSNKKLYEVLDIIGKFCKAPIPYVQITYEGRMDIVSDREYFIKQYQQLKKQYSNIKFEALSVKYGIDADGIIVNYDVLEHNETQPTERQYKALDGTTWHTFIPIPWLWNKFYYKEKKFDDSIYQFVDFL